MYSSRTVLGSEKKSSGDTSSLSSDSEASKQFAGAFSLEGRSFSAHSDNAIKKAEKFAKVQLNSLGCTPTAVTAVHHNEHFILCKASVDTSDHTQVDLSVPVQLSNGMPSIPEYFIQDEKLIKLNKENLYVHLKDKQNFKKKASVGKYSDQRAVHDYKIDTVVGIDIVFCGENVAPLKLMVAGLVVVT